MNYQFKPKSPYPALLSELQAALPNLPDSDKTFAASLCDGHIKYGGWSDKQSLWAQKMADKAKAAAANPLSAEGVAALAAVANLPPVIDNNTPFPTETPVTPVANDGEMSAIQGLFAKAAVHLKKPSIKINFGGIAMVLKPSVKTPGNILVTSDQPSGYYYSAKYYGTIFPDGVFKPKVGLNPDTANNVVSTLKLFAADPAGIAAQYGKLHGKCCFCNKGLTDEKSTTVGYGPVCAGHYGLPWGDNMSPGAAALKALAKKVVTGQAPQGIGFGNPASPFSPPKGALHEELKQVAKDAKASTGEKVIPVLSPEEYARMKARVEVLF